MKAASTSVPMERQFLKARSVSTPILAVRTADQAAAMGRIVAALKEQYKEEAENIPLLVYDVARGLDGLNEKGSEAFNDLGVERMMTVNPVEAFGLCLRLPKESVVFIINAHRLLDPAASPANPVVSQAVWNTREEFKSDRRMLVLLCPDMVMPPELAPDVLVLDEPLPDEKVLKELVVRLCKNTPGVPEPNEQMTADAVSAVAGLAAFPAEQVIAMSLSKKGINIDQLWERKRQAIEMTPGLSVYRGLEMFDDIGGNDNLKTYGRGLFNGPPRARPRGIVFIDEIEKQTRGIGGGDSSGVSDEMQGELLSWMQNYRASGLILIGPPGAAKSVFAKALGNEGGVPTIIFNMSGMKDSYVGASGRNLRMALKVVYAVTQGQVEFVATCNSLGSMSPELRRRFKSGTFFCDLPTTEECLKIWPIHLKRFEIKDQAIPVHVGWTGAEIEACCEIAWKHGISLVDAAKFIVPVAVSAEKQIDELRQQASGRFISASKPGLYAYKKVIRQVTGERKMGN